jgi:hypothetical protein
MGIINQQRQPSSPRAGQDSVRWEFSLSYNADTTCRRADVRRQGHAPIFEFDGVKIPHYGHPQPRWATMSTHSKPVVHFLT